MKQKEFDEMPIGTQVRIKGRLAKMDSFPSTSSLEKESIMKRCRSIYHLGFRQIRLQCEQEEGHDGEHTYSGFRWNDLLASIFG